MSLPDIFGSAQLSAILSTDNSLQYLIAMDEVNIHTVNDLILGVQEEAFNRFEASKRERRLFGIIAVTYSTKLIKKEFGENIMRV